MRKTAFLVFAALVLIAGPAMAQNRPQIKHLSANNPQIVRIADMPMTVTTDPDPAFAGPVTGPVAAASDTTMARGAALVSPVGGSVYTPEQRANAEIRQLIRRLDG